MLYVIQDTKDDPLKYICSYPQKELAEIQVKELLVDDAADGCIEKDRYRITERETCFADISESCGFCTFCICMADDPETQCPARKGKNK